LIKLTERTISGATHEVLVAPDDISIVGTDDTNPNLPTIVRIKSNPSILFYVVESVAEVQEKIDAASKQSGT
jgi:hypothetical protein